FNTNGGSEIDPVTAGCGQSVDLSQYIPEKTGFTFTGWYTDPLCKAKAEDSFILNDNAVLYAGWKTQECILSFDTKGGTKFAPVHAAYNTTIDLRKYTPIKNGYTFFGWFTDPYCYCKAKDQIALKSNTTLYAGWRPSTAQ
ncbi:MAG: InlB B-repeat-containing protein, partial [Erysipelotrichaceae bacterium]|nr:InlB B-repeat-containing protein [Erysipelotrichaceae bacterium]